jgi:hypothetical protein
MQNWNGQGWSPGNLNSLRGGGRPTFNSFPAQAPNWSHTLVLAATGVAQVFPGFLVPSGATVRVRANNGATAGNAQVIKWALYPGALLQGGGIPMLPLDDQSCLVRNTGNIWVMGTAGDGLVCTVSGLTT